MPLTAVLLFEDETILRLFPVLRRAWSERGKPATIPITGRNAKRVLFGAINPATGHRHLMRAPNMRQQFFHAFLRLLRQSYPGKPVWLILDAAPCHTASKSQTLAEHHFIWLPKQCSELNAMDQLWRGLKASISANDEYVDIDQHADFAQQWIQSLTQPEALLKAGILSKNFWLKSFFK